MIKDDFTIGCEFYTGTGKWICTDIGTRVIVAVRANEASNLSGRALYDEIEEHIWEGYDLDACDLTDCFNDDNDDDEVKQWLDSRRKAVRTKNLTAKS